jgi:mannan endo-1,4-beta-mannosidase
MKVVRIWGFYDKDNNGDPAIIQYSPGNFNEHALRALDFVLLKAGQYNLRVIITLVNNWEDYGGMNQYIEWLSKTSPSSKLIQSQKIIYRSLFKSENSAYYRYFVNGYKHDDFYSHPIVKEWYKNYVKMILTRTNVYKNIQYWNDTTIFAWELANEAESSDRSGMLINRWISEMAAFIRAIDINHLIGTGESGFDINSGNYSDVKFQYNEQDWIFNGEKGVSFYLNTQNKNIDFGSCHLYREDWNLSIELGKIWIEDHKNISDILNKPFILCEYGSRKDKAIAYSEWLKTIEKTSSSGALLWQLVYDSKPYDDGYFVYYSKDDEICKIIYNFSFNMNDKKPTIVRDGIYVSQNYPNPCVNFTTFEYSIPISSSVDISIYNILGQEITSYHNHSLEKGLYYKGINTSGLTSGIYFMKFSANGNSIIKKFQIIK